ncbi:chlorohydrolase family protein [Photobacterium sp.]|uniref:chlorohydrolase family protein n=1 Tax=Photobacterium sp. TaxID=660 RepID=UPI00299ECAD9|nr:chlorohydrolase family protein [Photobacterium sp.]MDX1301034.1 chlorohydrolase family protein [Photobacterium sp.]
MAITKLKGKYVIGYEDSSHQIYENGEVVFESDSVIFVGHNYPYPVDQTYDTGNSIIGPGFIDLDALADLDSTVLAFDNQPGWKKGRIPASTWQRRETYTNAELDFSKKYAFAHLLLNGVTTALPITSILYREWAETYSEFMRAADIAEDIGIRAYLGPAYMSGHACVEPDGSFKMRFNEEKGMSGLHDAVRFVEQVNQGYSSRIQGMFAPDRIEGCTQLLLATTAEAVQDLGCPVRLHACQGQFEVDMVEQRFPGLSSLDLISQSGLLSSHLLMPHAQFLGGKEPTSERVDQELSMFAEAGASAVVCPLVAGRHGKYIDSLTKFKAKKINIGLGTDTFPPDFIQNMHIGTILSRVTEGDIAAASAADYYNMATIGGADAIGRPDLGRLCRGAKADIVIFDLNSIHTGQCFDPITTLVINGNGRDVKGVFVDGEMVVWDHQLVRLNLDLSALHYQAQQQFNRFMDTFPERSHKHPPRDEIFPPSFPLHRHEPFR